MAEKTAPKYTFLHDHVAREPFIMDVLNEIQNIQDTVLRTGDGRLATLDALKDSRNIKMPFTPSRNKNIAYLLDTLSNNYTEEIRKVISFNFQIEPESKKIIIDENIEYGILMKHEDFNRIQEDRDRKSAESLLAMIGSFRLFNLTKLLKKAKNRSHFSIVVKSELGKNLFTYKNFSLDKSGMESSEDYCFHLKNYDAVKDSIDMESMRELIRQYSAQIARRLSTFGILNSEVNDYRDTKLDYILNILMNDITSTLGEKDLVEVKNFHSLRDCLKKVDKIIDPFLTVAADIMNHIKENGLTKLSDIRAMFPQAAENSLNEWMKNFDNQNKIILHEQEKGVKYLMQPADFFPAIRDLHLQIIEDADGFSKLNYMDQNEKTARMELLCEIGRKILNSKEKARAVLKNEETIKKAGEIIESFANFQKNSEDKRQVFYDRYVERVDRSLIGRIVSFFRSFFGGRKEKTAGPEDKKEMKAETVKKIRPVTQDTREILNRIKNSTSKIVPLSEHIELSHDNEEKIDKIIEDLRNHKLKVVIPIYSARKVLYPVRSQKVIIPDMEYLMVDPDVSLSSEIIREFTGSIAGEKIRDEVISSGAITAIEKYLLTLYRQRRARHMKKE